MYATTALLPEIRVGGHPLNFFCDLTRSTAMEEVLATCDTWLDLREDPGPGATLANEEECYGWATTKMLATLNALGQKSFRDQVLARVETEFFDKYGFPELRAALVEYFRNEDITGLASQPATSSRH